MPRKLRANCPGVICHVMRRANGKGKTFETDAGRPDFVKTLAGACAKTRFEIRAGCLMTSHFHLVIEAPL